MAQITITIADANVPLVMAAVAAYNAANGTTLTAPQWARRVLAEVILDAARADARTNIFLQKENEARALAKAAEEAVLSAL